MKVSFAFYCTCGASWSGSVPSMEAFNKFGAEWAKSHTGPGHAACDSKTAARARRKAEARFDPDVGTGDRTPRITRMVVR